MTDYLRSKVLPGQTSPVAQVIVDGTHRVALLEDGTKLRFTKQAMQKEFDAVLSAQQQAKALRGLREAPNGATKVTIGGERREYASKGNAQRAIHNHYGPYLK